MITTVTTKNKSSLIPGEIDSTYCTKSLTQLLEISEKEFKIIINMLVFSKKGRQNASSDDVLQHRDRSHKRE